MGRTFNTARHPLAGMRTVYVNRPAYTIAFAVTDDHDPVTELEYNGYGDGMIRAANIVAVERDLDISIRAKVTEGEYVEDGGGITKPALASTVGKMSASHSHSGDGGSIIMGHMDVDEEVRRQGIGSFLFDAYRAAAVWVGGRATGRIGSYEVSSQFLSKQGIPADDINPTSAVYSGGEAAGWNTDAENLLVGDRNVTVRDVDPEVVA